MKNKEKVIAGKKSKEKYEGVNLTELVGKKVEAVSVKWVESAYGKEPCTVLYFEDGTEVGFVVKEDDD